ncbi:MAG: glycoside hydrolase family 2 TIM barrel-domain containing protein [bacterium]
MKTYTRNKIRYFWLILGLGFFYSPLISIAFADNYGVLSSGHAGAILGGPEANAQFQFWWNLVTSAYTTGDNVDYMQGGHSFKGVNISGGTWFGMAVRSDANGNGTEELSDIKDMSAYSYIKFWVKSDLHHTLDNVSMLKIGIQSKNLSGTIQEKNLRLYDYGVRDDNVWRQISIPLAHFTGVNFTRIHSFFYIINDTQPPYSGVIEGLSFNIDDLRYSSYNLGSPTDIVIIPGRGYFTPGQSKDFKAWGFDINNELVSANPSWSVINGLASINPATGASISVTANTIGSDFLTAAQGGGSDTVPIFVNSATEIFKYNILSDVGIPVSSELRVFPDPAFGGPVANTVTIVPGVGSVMPEGDNCLEIIVGTANYGGIFIQPNDPVDLTDFKSGELKFSLLVGDVVPNVYVRDFVIKMKAEDRFNPGIFIESPEKRVSLFGYPMKGDNTGVVRNEWHEISIPLSSFEFDWLDFSKTDIVFLISPWDDTMVNPDVYNGLKFYVDNVRIEVEATQTGAASVNVDGYRLIVNGQPFTVKGVNYSPVPPGFTFGYDWANNPDIYETDFNLIKVMGANSIRLFADPYPAQTGGPFPALDVLYELGLFVIINHSVDPNTNWGNPVQTDPIRDDFLNIVNKYKNHPAVLFWQLGNEVSKQTGDVNGWYTFFNSCVSAAHAEEGVVSHPVSTSVTEVSFVNEAVADPDLWSVNIYYGPSFLTSFTNYAAKSDKPLVITEFGCDRLNNITKEEVQSIQASYIQQQWAEISSNLSEDNIGKVCAGGCVFEWVDEWWKSSGDINVHDETGDWTNLFYTFDAGGNNMNEEWWGITKTNSSPLGYREVREAYNMLMDLWNPNAVKFTIKNVSDNLEADEITWNSTMTSAWTVANQYIQIETDPGALTWGIQIYTDNVNSSPPYPLDPGDLDNIQDPSGIVSANSMAKLPVCWKITDELEVVPVEIPDQRLDLATNSSYFENGFLWFKDINTKDNPQTDLNEAFINGDYYQTIWDNEGIQFGGQALEHGLATSPNYLYIAADFKRASTPNEYKTTKLILEFFVP